MEIFGGKVFALTPSPQVTLNRGGLKLGRTVDTIEGYDTTKFGRDYPVNNGDFEVPKCPMLTQSRTKKLSTESIVKNSFTLEWRIGQHACALCTVKYLKAPLTIRSTCLLSGGPFMNVTVYAHNQLVNRRGIGNGRRRTDNSNDVMR